MRSPLAEEKTLARCRRAAEALNAAPPERKPYLAGELADLLAMLEAHTTKEPEAGTWLEAEVAAIRDSVLTLKVKRTALPWAAPLLLPRELVDAMSGDRWRSTSNARLHRTRPSRANYPRESAGWNGGYGNCRNGGPEGRVRQGDHLHELRGEPG